MSPESEQNDSRFEGYDKSEGCVKSAYLHYSKTIKLFSFQSQAEAHYKGNRHARRVKGIETSKTRPQDGEKLPSGPSSSPSPLGTSNSDNDSIKAGQNYELVTTV